MFMLLYATGSGRFNIRMRATAKRLGYLLNQRGLYKKVSSTVLRRIPVVSERALFKKLGMKYLAPNERLK
jgi:DNA polymerase/3'-5' exonuclease PolX